jgi:hypothetical protein
MKTKVILFALVIALMAGLAVPAFAAQPASAWGQHIRDADSPITTPVPPVQEPVQELVGTSATTATTPLGPIMIGMMTSGNRFVGIAATIKLGGDGTLKLANLKGISLDGTFRLTLAYDVAPTPGGSGNVVSGTLTSSGKLPKGNTIDGQYFDLEGISPALRGNYMILFSTFGSAANNVGWGDMGWGGMLLGSLPGLVTILPGAVTAMGGPDISFLMPTIQWLVRLINPFMQKHPIILIMPMASYLKLMPLMGM